MANVRNYSIVSAVEYAKQQYGEDGFKKILESIPEELRNVYIQQNNPMDWKPWKAFISFITAIEKLFGKGDYQTSYEIGKFSAEKEFSGIYKAFLEKDDPEMVIRRSNIAWRTVVDTGELYSNKLTKQSARLTLSKFNEHDKHHCHFLIGYFQRVLELTGAENVSVKECNCAFEGDENCIFEITWF